MIWLKFYLLLLFFLLFSSSCALDTNCTLEGRPSVCFIFQDINDSPAFPERITYQIKNPQYVGLDSDALHSKQLKALLKFESDRELTKAALLKSEGETIRSISIGAALHEKQMYLCIDNYVIGVYTFRFSWKEKTIKQVVEVRGSKCGPIREDRTLVLPFAYCDQELRNKYMSGQLHDFASCP